MPTIAELLAPFQEYPPDPSGEHYLKFHIRRFQALLEDVAEVLANCGPAPRILDVGLAYQTICMLKCFPQATVRTAGFYDCRFNHWLTVDNHTQVDLNDTKFPEKVQPGVPEYDVVVLAEVIEHLYVPAKPVLEHLKQWLKPGGTLILQTPNPVSLGKRVAAMRGVNPFEMIREDPTNPGHYCEFRVQDIRAAVESAGFTVTTVRTRNYFGRKSPLYDALCAILPGSLHDGITVMARK